MNELETWKQQNETEIEITVRQEDAPAFAETGYAPAGATEAAGNDGKILTSTLWNQSGTVYVSVNGKQTALSGYTYNMYCPNDSATSTTRTLTGCSNTADSQVLYYWIEQGYDFTFTVSAENYFVLESDKKQYNLSNSSQVGEATISQLNTSLATTDRIGNGDFIAALNFYCGVYNHSSYGSEGTSTTWWTGVYYDGTNAAAFKAAGFDSYYFVYAGDSSTGIFSGEKISDVGYSIIRENLDYGEPIRVGIPGHAIYMDGYRYNQTSRQYEYHLNYGWGVGARSTNWYTVNGLEEEKIKYLMLDLSPDISVTVSDARSDYYGGSFVRGIERINHIQNDKRTTFSFADSLKGETISLSSSVEFTSNVDLDFTNFQVTLGTTATQLISSARAMSFELSGGAMIVNNSASGLYAVRDTGDHAVEISLDNSYIYAGYQSGGIAAVKAQAASTTGYTYAAMSSSLFGSVHGSAVSTGSEADKLTLTNGSAVFGDLSLGAGSNVLNIESGSLFYGGFSGSANSLTVNLTINSSEYAGPMIVTTGNASDAAFFAAAAGVLNLNFADLSLASKTYGLYYGVTADQVQQFSVKVTAGSSTYTLTSANRIGGNFALDFDDAKLSLVYSVDRPQLDSITQDITGPTNQDVTLTVVFLGAATTEYSLDGKEWIVFQKTLKVSENGTYHFRGLSATGVASEPATHTVSNIDRIPPEKPSASADITGPTNQAVTVTAVFSKDSVKKEYSLDGENWSVYTTGIVFTANGTVYFRGTDAAGNLSEVTSCVVENIDDTLPEKPIPAADITAPTNKTVTVTAVFSADTVTKEYSLDGETWLEYTTGILFEDNGTVWFRGTDAAGNVSEIASYEVTNIDKVAPEAPTASADNLDPTNKPVTVTAAFSDDTVTKEYSLDGETWIAYPDGGVTLEENGTVYFRGTDEAGNVSDVTSCVVENIDTTAPDAPVPRADISSLTNRDVTVSATFDRDTVIREYSLDGETWEEYTGGIVFTENGTVYFRGTDAAGNLSSVAQYEVTNIDKTAPEVLGVTASITGPTNKDVVVRAAFTDDAVRRQYSLDDGATWANYNGGVRFTDNGTVWFRAIDRAGNVSEPVSYEVTNIDKVAPDAPVASADITDLTNQSVTVTAVFSDDSVQYGYSLDNKSWDSYPDDGVVFTDNGTVYFKSRDEAGNVSEITSYEVTNIDRTPPETPAVSADIIGPTNQDVTVTAVFSGDSATREYSLDGETWTAYTEDLVFTDNGTAYFRAADALGNVSETASYEVANIDRTPPEAPTVSADITDLTNQDVTVTAEFDRDAVTREYSLDGETWTAYTEDLVFTENGMAYFRGADVAGNVSAVADYEVSNIDKDAPEAPAVSADITDPTNQDVTVTAEFDRDTVTREYSLDGETWLEYTEDLVFTENGMAYFRGTDAAGNVSEITSYEVSNIDKEAPAAPVAQADITGPTNQDVTVTAEFSEDSETKEYSLDGETWEAYTDGVVFTENGTAYFRGADAVGNVSEIASCEVTNIDKVAPIRPVVSANITALTNKTVTVIARFSTDSAVKEYSLDGETWTEYKAGLKFTENGTAYFRAADAAGNVSEIASYEVTNIDTTAPDAPVALADITEPTRENVTVTATFSEDSVAKEYSLDGKAWSAYTAGILFSANGTVLFRAADAAGNVSVTTFAVTNIDRVPPEAPTAQADVTDPTNADVTVTAAFSEDSTVREYSLDGETWSAYTEGIVFSENGTAYFRAADAAGNVSETASYEVSNIDRTPPAAPVAQADITAPTRERVTVTATFSEDSVQKEYSLDGETWEAYTEGIVFAENGTVLFRGTDAAGNVSEAASYEVTNIVVASRKGDLNGDGRADVVMTVAQAGHDADGATGAWLIQADQTPAWGDLSTRSDGWEIFGTGHTTPAKGSDDVYIRSTGNVIGAWVTDAAGNVTGWETVGTFEADARIVGLGDFDGNGQTDLLLRSTDGAVGCYFTDGGGWNYFQSLGDEWTLSAIGDLNGDGRDDVVLKHDAGFAGSWIMQADGKMKWADLDTLQEGFGIVGSGDFDGDGTDDVLLRKGTYYGAWLVEDGGAYAWFGLGDFGDVTVERIADFDGDGTDDLLVRTAAGDIGAQLVKGADTLEWKYYGSVGAEWSTSLAAL